MKDHDDDDDNDDDERRRWWKAMMIVKIRTVDTLYILNWSIYYISESDLLDLTASEIAVSKIHNDIWCQGVQP